MKSKQYPLPLEDIEKLYNTPGSNWRDYRAKLACLLILDGVVTQPRHLDAVTVPQVILDLGLVDLGHKVQPLQPKTIETARLWFSCRRQRGSEQRVFVDYFGRPLRKKIFITGIRLKRAKVYRSYHGLSREWAWRVLGQWFTFETLRACHFARLLAEHPDTKYMKLFAGEPKDARHRWYHRIEGKEKGRRGHSRRPF